MATRAEMRTSVRVRLEDTGGTPLFPDADLNELLSQALGEYGSLVPTIARTTVVVAAAATEIALPAGVSEYSIVSLRDATAADIRIMAMRSGRGPAGMSGYEQAWRAAAGKILLQRAVTSTEAGTWSIEYRTARVLPGADGTTMPVEAGDEAAVIELTMARVYDRKVFEDYKRGVTPDPSNELAKQARQRANEMLAHRKRAANMGWIDVA